MKTCYNCFKEYNGDVCTHCGYNSADDEGKFPHALPSGTILNGSYIIGRVIGQGGFGITYVAQEYDTKERVAIKEYLPEELCTRTEINSQVMPFSGERTDYFIYGKECFLTEAKTLAEFRGNENIVNVRRYFEENGTAYLVMDFIEGISLYKYIDSHGGTISVDEANSLLFPVMDALYNVHSNGIVHRDIAPDNIIITKDGNTKLIDFGAARYSTGEKSKSLDVILKHGFAPREQYSRHGRQGPFTDIYALAATYYYSITGLIPPDAIDRINEDTILLPSKLGVKISKEAEAALMKALSVKTTDRYQTMHEFHSAMEGNAVSETDDNHEDSSLDVVNEKKHVKKGLIIGIIALIFAVAAGVFAFLNRNNDDIQEEPAFDEQIAETVEEPVSNIIENNTGIKSIGEIEVGDSILFGNYRSNYWNEEEKAPIEWVVLEKQDNKLFILSRYVIASKDYNDETNIGASWENSSIRAWLNGEFYNEAFTSEEQSKILQTDHFEENYDGAGNETTDYVFLLSRYEAKDYFASDEDRICDATEFGRFYEQNGVPCGNAGTNCDWWLRSLNCENLPSEVSGDGWIPDANSTNYPEGVRPAMWIEYLADRTTEIKAVDDEFSGEDISYDFGDLKVEKTGDHITVAVKNIEIKDQYTIYRPETPDNKMELGWTVNFNDGYSDYRLGTMLFKFQGSEEQETKMEYHSQNSIFGDDFNYMNISMTHDATSIQWDFDMTYDKFIDFSKVEKFEVNIYEYNITDETREYYVSDLNKQ